MNTHDELLISDIMRFVKRTSTLKEMSKWGEWLQQAITAIILTKFRAPPLHETHTTFFNLHNEHETWKQKPHNKNSSSLDEEDRNLSNNVLSYNPLNQQRHTATHVPRLRFTTPQYIIIPRWNILLLLDPYQRSKVKNYNNQFGTQYLNAFKFPRYLPQQNNNTQLPALFNRRSTRTCKSTNTLSHTTHSCWLMDWHAFNVRRFRI